MADDQPDVPTPTLERVLELDVEVADPIDIGETGNGRRRIVPIERGTVSGRVEGHILPGGADYQLFRLDRPTLLVAHYGFETADGDRVYVENRGLRHADRRVKERLRDGKPVDPDDVYFQSVPQFETAAPELEWLANRVFVAGGTRRPNGVKLAVFQVG
ncbi:MAG: DUF3237 domain-containing protein [Halobacteriales archaeon]